MMKRLFAACIAVGSMTVTLSAQQKPAAPPSAQAGPEAAAPSVEVKRRNVSIEVKLTDQTGTSEPVTKVVTMIVADGRLGSVRSAGRVMVPVSGPAAPPFPTRSSAGVTLNVDANPLVHSDGSVLLSLTLEYSPRPEGPENTGGAAQLNEKMTVTLESGKPMVISRAADPAGNRKINVEVTATVMK